ncbi:MAG: sensor histidine kinase [Fluviicola sp.]|jgi:sensor histidine kinase YesM
MIELYFITLGIIIISALVFIKILIQRVKKVEHQKSEVALQLIETEAKALRTQLNPHFLFNSLNSIRLFILKNDSESAENYISKFSKLLRLVLNQSRKDIVTVYDEIQTLKLYLEFEQLRFDAGFEFEIQIDGQEVLKHFIPPMLLQPFVENAIWHGLMHRKDNGGKIKISFQNQVSGLYVSIQDNGVGRKIAQGFKTNQSINEGSVGLTITKERMKILAKRTNLQNDLEIEDLVDDKNQAIGTLVNLYFESKLNL